MEKKQTLIASDFIIKNNNLYTIPLNFPYYIKYDISMEKILNYKRIFSVDANTQSYFETIHKYGDFIYAIPMWADYVLAVNLVTDEIMKIEIEYKDTEDEKCGSYFTSFVCGSFIYAFKRFVTGSGEDTYNVLKIECEKNRAYVKRAVGYENYEKIEKYTPVFRKGCHLIGKDILLFGQDLCWKYSINDESLKKCNISTLNKIDVTCSTELGDDSILLVTSCNEIIIWNYKNNNFIRKEIPKNLIKRYDISLLSENYSSCIKYKDVVYIIGSSSDSILEFDLSNYQINSSWMENILCGGFRQEKNDYCFGQFSKPCLCGELLYLWNIWKEKFYHINLETREIKEKSVEIYFSEDECVNEIEHEIKKGIIIENKNIFCDLNNYISYITRE